MTIPEGKHKLIVNDLEIEGLVGPMSDEEFQVFCSRNREMRIERDSNGNVIIMPPVFSETGRLENELAFQLNLWNRQSPRKGYVFSSSTGFTLPNRAIRSPDAAWISAGRWEALTSAERRSFAPIAPEFVAGICSASDNPNVFEAKMKEWIANGVRLAWLIDPLKEEVSIFRSGRPVEVVVGFDQRLSGEDILKGFQLDLGAFKPQ